MLDEGVGEGGVFRGFRDAEIIARKGCALARDDDFHIAVLLLRGDEIAGVAVDEVELAGCDAGFVLLVLEFRDVRFPLDREGGGGLELGGVGGIEGVAEAFQGGSEDFAHVIEQGGAAFDFRTGIEAPRRLRFRQLGFQVGDAGRRHHVGDGNFHFRVEGVGEVGLVDVVEVREFRVIERLEESLGIELLHGVGGGDEDIVSGGSGFELGDHRLVGIEGVDDEFAVVRLLEGGGGFLTEVVRPGENGQGLLRCFSRAGWQEIRGKRGGRGGDEMAAFHRCYRFTGRVRRWEANTSRNVKRSMRVESALMTGSSLLFLIME